jgi:pyruvate carboxylase
MKVGEDATVEIAPGKTLLIRLQGVGPVNEKGLRTIFFKLNGQTRNIEVQDRSIKITHKENRKVDKANGAEMGAPLQGLLSKVLVKSGEPVKKNQPLFVIEAMKMETTITAPADSATVVLELPAGTLVNTGDLVLTLG